MVQCVLGSLHSLKFKTVREQQQSEKLQPLRLLIFPHKLRVKGLLIITIYRTVYI